MAVIKLYKPWFKPDSGGAFDDLLHGLAQLLFSAGSHFPWTHRTSHVPRLGSLHVTRRPLLITSTFELSGFTNSGQPITENRNEDNDGMIFTERGQYTNAAICFTSRPVFGFPQNSKEHLSKMTAAVKHFKWKPTKISFCSVNFTYSRAWRKCTLYIINFDLFSVTQKFWSRKEASTVKAISSLVWSFHSIFL